MEEKERLRRRATELYLELASEFPWLSKEELEAEVSRRLNEELGGSSPHKEQVKNIEIMKESGKNESTKPLTAKPLPFQEVYKWACQLTAEQGVNASHYLWTPETRSLLRRLKHTKNNLIAVIGLQGSGKTALKNALAFELSQINYKCLDFKWIKAMSLEKILEDLDSFTFDSLSGWIPEQYLHDLLDALAETYGLKTRYDVSNKISKIFPKLSENDYWAFVHYYQKERFTSEEYAERIRSLVPLIERKLGQKRVKKLRQQLIQEKLSEIHTILIDFPDYDRYRRGQMIKDLLDFQNWFDSQQFFADIWGEERPNVVVFWQKELWGGHFIFGKFDVFELKPLKPEQLVSYYINLFGSAKRGMTAPFTKEALYLLASLARGIFRRFKKYIRVCLDNYYNALEEGAPIEKIDVNHVREWITLDQIVKDWDLELMDIWPKAPEKRKKAVEILLFLQTRDSISQKEIREKFFETDVECSRFLSKLEARDYITREKEGREKIIKLRR